MNKLKALPVVFFVLLVLAQLYVPAQMIFDRQSIINQGALYKFRMAPIDPFDPFRGEYIRLSFDATDFHLPGKEDFQTGQTLYAEIGIDAEGFAEVKNISPLKPESPIDYATVKFQWAMASDTGSEIHFRYPFDRFYVKEGTAYDSEQKIREAILDSSKIAYAFIRLKEGDGIVTDVMVNDQSLKDLLSEEP